MLSPVRLKPLFLGKSPCELMFPRFINRRIRNLDFLPSRYAITSGLLPASSVPFLQLTKNNSRLHRCRQDPYAIRYRQVSRSKSPHRHIPHFRVERLADLGRVQLVGSFRTIIAQEGYAHIYTSTLFLGSHVRFSGLDGCTEVWFRALTRVRV